MEQISQQHRLSLVLSRLLILTGLFIIFLFIFSFIALFISSLLFRLSLAEILDRLNSIQYTFEIKMMHYIQQGVSALGAFILGGYTYMIFIERAGYPALNQNPTPTLKIFLLTLIITLVMMPFTSLLITWNEQMKFPSFMASFERWAMEKEDLLKRLTLFLTFYTNTGELMIGFLILALLPAIGEELIFRGILQRNLCYILNPHLAIVLAGFIFSFIHLQFYGFFPRWLLGILFGYLYFWSGNILIPVFAHFVNNGFTLLMVHLHNQQLVKFNIEGGEAMPLYYVIPSVALTIWLIFWFRKIHIKTS